MRRVLIALSSAALLAACGGSGGSSDGATQTTMDHGAMPSGTQAPAGAARPVRLTVNDQLRFQPATLAVKHGETVTFTVTNSGKLTHEFVVGDQAFQSKHEQEMQEMAGSGMSMHDDADGISLPAGATKTLTYTFEQPGTLFYGCHVSGHYQAGMKGTITVS